MFNKLFGKRDAREKWDAGLRWFRLRYLEAAGPERCINLLSRPQACGRVALYYQPGEAVAQLYLGVPETHVRLLQRMAADFRFSLKSKPLEVTIPAAERMTAVSHLPWGNPFLAHITHEAAFVSLVEGKNKSGSYLPQPASVKSRPSPATWHLPGEPPPGLTTRPAWKDGPLPAHLIAAEPDPRCWLLGRSPTGIPLHVSGRVNIYGRQEAVADWLVQQVTQIVTLDHSHLVVIDGAGNLVPRLKRKAAVTRLLGEQLAYVDIDGASLAGGFNPLAAVPGESEAAVVQRWQRWFAGMHVHPQGVHLLARAGQEGVGDIPGLRKWLKQVERQGQYTAVASLGMALNRLTASRALREWLEWPANRFDILPEGALFFACKGTGWDRQQLLRAVFLAVMQMSNMRIVVHGLPWKMLNLKESEWPGQMIISNGPQVAGATTLLVETGVGQTTLLTERFLGGDKHLAENLALLQRGEGICVHRDGSWPVFWKSAATMGTTAWTIDSTIVV